MGGLSSLSWKGNVTQWVKTVTNALIDRRHRTRETIGRTSVTLTWVGMIGIVPIQSLANYSESWILLRTTTTEMAWAQLYWVTASYRCCWKNHYGPLAVRYKWNYSYNNKSEPSILYIGNKIRQIIASSQRSSDPKNLQASAVAGIWTLGWWVKSANATSVLCCAPRPPKCS